LFAQLVFNIFNLCGHDPPTLQTDRQTTCDLKTALCTVVHRAAISLRLTFENKYRWNFWASNHRPSSCTSWWLSPSARRHFKCIQKQLFNTQFLHFLPLTQNKRTIVSHVSSSLAFSRIYLA